MSIERYRYRDRTIDFLRGVAIITMLAANLAGAGVLRAPHPFLMRLYGSFAAAVLVFIAGMMVSETARLKKHTLRHYVLRGLLILGMGILVDVTVWNIFPFITFDILYLIGLSIPAAYLVSRLKPALGLGIAAFFFLAAPVLRTVLGYSVNPMETGIVHHWFIDGWFPVFPWFGFAFAGTAFGRMRYDEKKFPSAATPKIALGLLLAGAVLWGFNWNPQVREGYSELFYPPTTGYVLISLALILAGFYYAPRVSGHPLYIHVGVLGECPLLLYLVQLFVIRYLLLPLASASSLIKFLMYYGLMLAAAWALAEGVKALRDQWDDRPGWLSYFLGG